MWIECISPVEAEGRLKRTLEALADSTGRIDNVLLVHGRRPHTLDGHLALYRSVLHHPGNHVPRWLLEAIGVLVSRINGCEYCVTHHSQGLRRAMTEPAQAEAVLEALMEKFPADSETFSERERAALTYAEKLTREPASVQQTDIEAMRRDGWNDAEILEINQVTAYFAYVNRTVLGLGIELEPWRK